MIGISLSLWQRASGPPDSSDTHSSLWVQTGEDMDKRTWMQNKHMSLE